MKSLRLLALAWLQTAPSALQAPPTPPTGQAPLQALSSPRLGFLELQYTRGGPRRVVFSAPAVAGVQQPLFELLRGRDLLGLCKESHSFRS